MRTGDTIEHKDFGRGKIIERIRVQPDLMQALLAVQLVEIRIPHINFVVCFKVDFVDGGKFTFTKDALEYGATVINSVDAEETTTQSTDDAARPALSTEEVEARLYQLLIQQRDVDGTRQFLKDAIADRNGDRTEKERDFSTLESIKINHRETYYRMQNQLVEYFGIKLEDVIEDQYRKNDNAENVLNIDESISPLEGLRKWSLTLANEDPTFLVAFLNELPAFDSILIEHLKHLRENHPIFFECVSGAYKQLANKSLEGEMGESPNKNGEDAEAPRLNAVSVEYIINAHGGISKSGVVPYRPEIGDRKKTISMEHHSAGTIFTVTSKVPEDCTCFGSEYFLPLDENVALDAADRYENHSKQ